MSEFNLDRCIVTADLHLILDEENTSFFPFPVVKHSTEHQAENCCAEDWKGSRLAVVLSSCQRLRSVIMSNCPHPTPICPTSLHGVYNCQCTNTVLTSFNVLTYCCICCPLEDKLLLYSSYIHPLNTLIFDIFVRALYGWSASFLFLFFSLTQSIRPQKHQDLPAAAEQIIKLRYRLL